MDKIRREATRHFRGKEWNIRKTKLMSLKQIVGTKNIRDLYRDIQQFKKGEIT
jgi:hypothetical protein